jgi:hypothetical protein
MENNPDPAPPVEVKGPDQGDLPVDDPPPSGRPEEHAPVEEPKRPEERPEKKKKIAAPR